MVQRLSLLTQSLYLNNYQFLQIFINFLKYQTTIFGHLRDIRRLLINEKLNKEDLSYIYSIKTFDYFFQNKRQRVHKCYFHNPYSRVILIEIVNQ